MELRGKLGSIRYFGQLRNNPKAGTSNWLGIEWDDTSSGKHNGTVDGEIYFTPEFDAAATQSCSFIRHGKIDIGGEDFKKALMQRYKPENMMSEEEKEIERKKLEAE